MVVLGLVEEEVEVVGRDRDGQGVDGEDCEPGVGAWAWVVD
jgi:hypothetical protein